MKDTQGNPITEEEFTKDIGHGVVTQDWKVRFRKLWSSINGDNQHLTTERIEGLIESLLKEERYKGYEEGRDDGFKEAKNAVLSEERQFVLNVLDGIDIADAQMGIVGGTQAIRQALESRIIKHE